METAARARVIEWLMFQMASVGPMFGQLDHFRNAAPEKLPYAIARYQNETLRLLGVLDEQLANNPHIAGDYSIADIATYPWVVAANTNLGISLDELPNVQQWVTRMQTHPAVQTGMAILTPAYNSDYGTVAPPVASTETVL